MMPLTRQQNGLIWRERSEPSKWWERGITKVCILHRMRKAAPLVMNRVSKWPVIRILRHLLQNRCQGRRYWGLKTKITCTHDVFSSKKEWHHIGFNFKAYPGRRSEGSSGDTDRLVLYGIQQMQ